MEEESARATGTAVGSASVSLLRFLKLRRTKAPAATRMRAPHEPEMAATVDVPSPFSPPPSAVSAPSIAVLSEEGASEGARVGANVGANVGLELGASVGPEVGLELGANVGPEVGLALGASVGLTDGLALGELVGDAEGAGAEVGDPVGDPVGGVGARVGVGVGGSVGAAVKLMSCILHVVLEVTESLSSESPSSTDPRNVTAPSAAKSSRPGFVFVMSPIVDSSTTKVGSKYVPKSSCRATSTSYDPISPLSALMLM